MARISIEEFAMLVAKASQQRSEDPYTKVGVCVLRSNKTIAATGYNGAPPGIEIDWSNRDEKNKRVIHAESNALSYLNRNEDYLLMACTHIPCLRCLAKIALYKIPKVVYDMEYAGSQLGDLDDVFKVAKEFGIELIQYNG